MDASTERMVINDIKRIIRDAEDLREKLRIIERKIDDITNQMIEKQLSKRIIK